MPKQVGNLTLYSVDDLHEQLGLSKMTIRAYLRDGKIRGRKLGVKWYVTEEVCKLLNISRRTLQNMRDNQTIKFRKAGRKIYYKARDIEEYLESISCKMVNEEV